MPRETVYDETGEFDIHVGWARDSSDVQVGVETHDGQHVVSLDGQDYAGLWCTLNRAGCNRLIRLLRQARDTAFGKDE